MLHGSMYKLCGGGRGGHRVRPTIDEGHHCSNGLCSMYLSISLSVSLPLLDSLSLSLSLSLFSLSVFLSLSLVFFLSLSLPLSWVRVLNGGIHTISSILHVSLSLCSRSVVRRSEKRVQLDGCRSSIFSPWNYLYLFD